LPLALELKHYGVQLEVHIVAGIVRGSLPPVRHRVRHGLYGAVLCPELLTAAVNRSDLFRSTRPRAYIDFSLSLKHSTPH
jgi:hypothetical protein